MLAKSMKKRKTKQGRRETAQNNLIAPVHLSTCVHKKKTFGISSPTLEFIPTGAFGATLVFSRLNSFHHLTHNCFPDPPKNIEEEEVKKNCNA